MTNLNKINIHLSEPVTNRLKQFHAQHNRERKTHAPTVGDGIYTYLRRIKTIMYSIRALLNNSESCCFSMQFLVENACHIRCTVLSNCMILRCDDLSFHRGCSIKYVYSTKPSIRWLAIRNNTPTQWTCRWYCRANFPKTPLWEHYTQPHIDRQDLSK